MEPPDALVEAVLAGRCVAFVGAGFSAAVVPTWERLLREVAREPKVPETARGQILDLIQSGGPLSLEAAAQMLVRQLGPKLFSETLASLLQKPEMNETQESRLTHLRGVPFRGILTTNFDLRTCALCDAEYEWGVHAFIFGAQAGLDGAALEATTADLDTYPWEPDERLVLTLMDALHENATIDDALFTELSACFDPAQIVELTMLSGLYHAVGFIVNVSGVEVEPWAPRWSRAAMADS